jgi:hypothetical protein
MLVTSAVRRVHGGAAQTRNNRKNRRIALARERFRLQRLPQQGRSYAASRGCSRERSGKVWLSRINSSPSHNGPASPSTGLSIIFSPIEPDEKARFHIHAIGQEHVLPL